MKGNRTLLAIALVLGAAGTTRAQDGGIGPLQVRSEKLAKEAGAAVVALSARRGAPTRVGEALDAQSGAAGFLIDEEGYILTAASFAPESGRVDVTLAGHHHARAEVVGRDARLHIALLKLQDPAATAKMLGRKLPHLVFGHSSELKRGRMVATVGNTFDSLATDGVAAFSMGIVSSLGRVRDADAYKGYAIETDAAVNPGSFGGPLIDLKGRVVGVVVEAISPKRWLGVAVPIDEVALVLPDLKAGKTPSAPHLGLSVTAVGEATTHGLKIAEISTGGPAAKAGLKEGDALVSFDGKRVVETFDIERELDQLAQGAPVELGIVRGGKSLNVVVTLGARPRTLETTTTNTEKTEKTEKTEGQPYLGLKAEDRAEGVFVTEVMEDGPAAKAKIAVGSQITRLNNKAIKSKKDIIEVLKGLSPGDKVTLRVDREGWEKDVTITLTTKGGAPKTEDKPDTTKPKKKPFLGVGTQPNDDGEGLVVAQVVKDSAAAKAKLQQGDVILEADGKKVDDPQVLTALIQTKKPGDKLKLKISRDGATKDLEVTLGERPEEADQPANPHEGDKPKDEGSKAWIGFALIEKGGRLVVDEVAAKSPASDAGIKAGDVIVGVKADKGHGGKPGNLDDLDKILSGCKVGDKLTLAVERDGWTKDVTLSLAEMPKDRK